jgi:AcrR family transcriptional regulator
MKFEPMNTTQSKEGGARTIGEQERRDARRQQVLDAAAACFRKHGFHGASMSQICKAAGMSAGHVYNFFQSKDDIIAAFVQINVEKIVSNMRHIAQQPDTLSALLSDLEERVAEHVDPELWSLSLEIYAEASRNPVIAKLLREGDLLGITELRANIRVARERLGMPLSEAELDSRTELIVAMFQGIQLRALHNPGLDHQHLSKSLRTALQSLLLAP